MKKQTKITMILVLLLAVNLFTISITSCAIKHTAAGQQVPATPWEQVNLANAELATANNSLAQAIIAASNAKSVSDKFAEDVTTAQFRIAAWQKELTPLLASAQQAQSSMARVKQLISSITGAAAQLVASGNAGAAANAQHLAAAITSLNNAAQNLLNVICMAANCK